MPGTEALLGLPGTAGGWATLGTKHAFREHLPSSLWEGARTAIVFTLSRFFSREEQVASGTLEEQPCRRKGGGAGKGRTKPRPRSPR